MSKIMDWLENKFAPAMSKITQNPWVSALSGSMMKILPIIMTGSLIFFYNVFRSWIPALPDLGGVLQFTFQLTSLILTFLVANQLMEKLGHTRYVLNAGLTAIIAFLIAIKPTISDDNIFSVGFDRFGPTGMFVALVVGVLVSVVYHLYAKLHILEDSVTIPDFVCEWINQILPMFACVLVGTIISNNLNVDMYQVISAVFSPLEHLGRTLPGLIIMMMAISFLYSMGISTWFLGTFTTPILMAGTAANLAQVAAGQTATNIVCYETIYLLSLMTLGGQGCTLTLNVHMLLSKSKRLKSLGKVCIGPSIFNINEPVVFGAPIVFNPILMLPMWINTLVSAVIIWFVMSWGWLAVPAASVTTGQIPAPIGYIIVTGDWRAIIFWVLIFVVTFLIWKPFFKVYEKQIMKEEAEEEAA
jgi:PTS system cellobiose-specific IIC component